MDRSGAERLRKTVCGVCMVLAPLFLFASDLAWPVSHTKVKRQFADAVGSTGRAYTGMVLCLVGMCLLVGAVIGVAHLLHERRPGMAITGGGLTIIGIVAISAIVGWMGLYLSEAAKPGRDHAALAQLLDDMYSKMWPMGVASFLAGVGLLVLGVGLYRTRVAPMWAAGAVMLGGILADIGNPLAFKPVIFASEILLFIGLGAVGLTVLAETDEEWQHTPEFHGFRHVPAHAHA